MKLGRQRPIVIQSLFASLDGEEPPVEEVEQYVQRLKELQQGGARISLVQVYSAHRPAICATCHHLPLRSLSRIAQRVREVTGLKAEVFNSGPIYSASSLRIFSNSFFCSLLVLG